MNITPKEKKCLEFIAAFIKKNGFSPTYQEIMKHFDLKAVSTVHQYITQLLRKGKLEIKGKNQKRALTITENSNEICLFGYIAAGKPVQVFENAEPIEVPSSFIKKNRAEYYALNIKGNSMQEDGIFNGDIVVICRQTHAETGETVVALIDNNEATLKRYYPKADSVELRPANSELKSLHLPAERVQIQGVLIGLIRKYE